MEVTEGQSNEWELAIARATADAAREAWLPLWPLWKRLGGHPSPDGLASHDTCIPSSFALCQALQITAPTLRWRVVGGRPTKRTPAGGFRDRHGRVHPHFWIQGIAAGAEMIADVTADQFDGDPVIVGINDGRYTANATRALIARYCDHEAAAIDLFVRAVGEQLRLAAERVVIDEPPATAEPTILGSCKSAD